jgi:hypothetical protein
MWLRIKQHQRYGFSGVRAIRRGNATRWGSNLKALESYLANRQAIQDLVNEHASRPKKKDKIFPDKFNVAAALLEGEEWQLGEELVYALREAEAATVKLQSSDATASIALQVLQDVILDAQPDQMVDHKRCQDGNLVFKAEKSLLKGTQQFRVRLRQELKARFLSGARTSSSWSTPSSVTASLPIWTRAIATFVTRA